ncbi:MAG: hypothetical protein FJW31_16925 [Acidobacteria bacterium]|nr:hypothetical protein [Acidobacteriota bacterium]
MADRELLVFADLGGQPILAGRLWAKLRRDRDTATFEYDSSWLSHPNRYSLEPALALGPGPFHTGADQPLFGALGDSAPDRWGRALLRCAARRRAEALGETPRTLREIDFLMQVDDESRQGALRFAAALNGPFLAPLTPEQRVPPVIQLPKLLAAARRVSADKETAADLRLLLAPGSSLGGARPKVCVPYLDGSLAIAKFPHQSDQYDAVTWEAIALALAGKAGIEVPPRRVETINRRRVLIVERFDRRGASVRVPFLSALSMLGARDGETGSYLEWFVRRIRG